MKGHGKANPCFLQTSPWVTCILWSGWPLMTVFLLAMDLPGADSASVPNCPLHFALGITHSSALSVWPLPPPRTDHSVPKPTLLYSGNRCETLERKKLIFISMKIKTAWRPPFPSCSGQAELQPLLAVLGMPREC